MRVAIVGYGNLGRGVEAALCAAPDSFIMHYNKNVMG